MTTVELLELLIPFMEGHTTSKYIKDCLSDVDLRGMLEAERAKTTRPAAKPAPTASADIIQSLFESEEKQPGPEYEGIKEYYHAENKQGKRCFDDHRQKELEQGITYTDPGSSPFAANRPGRCGECGQTILRGDLIILRSKERAPQ